MTEGEPITGTAPCTECVDKTAREVLGELIETLADEFGLDNNYGCLLERLGTGAVSEEQGQPAGTKAVEEERLSNSEINDLFGGWAE